MERERTFSSTLQKKYIRSLTWLLIPFVLFTIFITANLWHRIDVQSQILSRNYSIIAATEKAMVAVRDGNNYLLKALLIRDPQQFYQLWEDSKQSWMTSESLVNAITDESGSNPSNWYQQRWQEEIQSKNVPSELKQASGSAGEYLGGFSTHAKRAMEQLDRSYDLASKQRLAEARQARELAWQEIVRAGRFQELANGQLEKLVNIARDITRTSQKNLHRMQYENILLIILNAVVLLVLMNMFSWYFIKKLMVNPIARLTKQVNRFGKGDLNTEVPVETDDEVGQLASQFNKMRDDLRKIMVSKEHVDDIVTSIPDSLIILDANAQIKSVNRATVDLLGYKKGEIVDKPFGEIFSSDWGKKLAITNLESVLGKRKGRYVERAYLNKKDRKIPVLFSYSAIPDESKSQVVYLCVAQDLTEHKHIEAEKHAAQHQLQEAQKMESIGQLAGGIAHDFNNLLGGVLGYAQLIQKRAELSDSSAEFITKIVKLSKRAAELTAQLLTFARKSQHEKVLLNINEIVQESADILSRTLEKRTEVKVLLDDKLQSVVGDSSQILQILMNLGLNAYDAMPKGGIVTFKTDNFTADNAFCRKHSEFTPGDYVKLTVSDTGTGIPKKYLSKVFEPFFTTKPVGKGTGLGLSMVYGIMQQHGGIAKVDSEVGKGTMFSLYFPVVLQEEVLKSEGKEKSSVEPSEIDKTILVVDDEGYMRELVEQVLKQKNTRLLFAKNGEEAIQVFRKTKDNIDCIVLDVVMPKVDGVTAYKEIIKCTPDVKVLFFSGYTESNEVRKLLKAGQVDFIQKPFDSDELIGKIVALLKE